MENTVRIVKIDTNGIITAVPVISEACLSCSESSCKKTGKPFEVANPLNIPVSEGCSVTVATSAQAVAKQAVTAILFPTAAAIAGYIAPAAIFEEKSFTVSVRIAFAVVFLGIAVITVLFFSRKTADNSMPYITGKV